MASEYTEQYEVEKIMSRDDETNTYEIKWLNYVETTFEPIETMMKEIPEIVINYEYNLHTNFSRKLTNETNFKQLLSNHFYKAPVVLGFYNNRVYFSGREFGVYYLYDNGIGGSSTEKCRVYDKKAIPVLPKEIEIPNSEYEYKEIYEMIGKVNIELLEKSVEKNYKNKSKRLKCSSTAILKLLKEIKSIEM